MMIDELGPIAYLLSCDDAFLTDACLHSAVKPFLYFSYSFSRSCL